MVALLEHRRPEHVELHVDLPELTELRGYPAELNQLIMNLVVNALEAVGDEGRITITGEQTDDEVRLVIQDDGCGIASEQLDEVFDPGFTTKGVGVGGGYGLSIVYRIAEHHGGAVTVDSTPNRGTRVTVCLPL